MVRQSGKLTEQGRLISDQSAKLTELAERLDSVEQGEYEYYGEYEEQNVEYDENYYQEEMETLTPGPLSQTQNEECAQESSRFSGMRKKYKSVEKTDVPIDSGLVGNITELFRNGIIRLNMMS